MSQATPISHIIYPSSTPSNIITLTIQRCYDAANNVQQKLQAPAKTHIWFNEWQVQRNTRYAQYLSLTPGNIIILTIQRCYDAATMFNKSFRHQPKLTSDSMNDKYNVILGMNKTHNVHKLSQCVSTSIIIITHVCTQLYQ